MAKIVCFVPREEMVSQVWEAASAQLSAGSPYALEVRAISTANAVSAARKALSQGADILIARGAQAMLIKQAVDIPIVPISLTGQEMAQLILRAKTMLSPMETGAIPRIAVVGFSNMFCDMSSFNQLYQIDLRCYLVESSEQLSQAALTAVQDGAQLLIGGDAVCEKAWQMGVPVLFLTSGKESVAEALRVAEQVAYASDLEKRNTAQFRTLLDHTHNGILRVSSDGIITHANHPAEQLLSQPEQRLLGQKLSQLFGELTDEQLSQVLRQGEELFSVDISRESTTLVLTMTPVMVDGRPDGAILSFHEGRRLEEMETRLRRELYRREHTGAMRFEELVSESPAYRQLLQQAKYYASLSGCILLTGEPGTGKETIARCIHGFSDGPFVHVPCSCIEPQNHCDAIFGQETPQGETLRRGYVQAAEGGTLYLEDFGALHREAQYRLCRLIQHQLLLRGSGSRPIPARVRVIVSDCNDLESLLAQGLLLEKLYYTVIPLHLALPSLRQRREDILPLVQQLIKRYQQRYSRYIHLTSGAQQYLQQAPWPGNLTQLSALCKQLVLTSPRRSVDELFISHILQPVSIPAPIPSLAAQSPVGQQAKALEEALAQSAGNRQKAARLLGIHPSTLWRRMKKYGIRWEQTER